ncbi:MAG TPA: hypothetical protein VGM51_08960 [Armatimonadota bacterium]
MSSKLGFGVHLVANPLGVDLAFHLREREQKVAHHPTHRCGGVELLLYADQPAVVPVHQPVHCEEVGKRAGDTIKLVHHDGLDLADLDVSQKTREFRSLHILAGEAVIHVVFDELPWLAHGYLHRDALGDQALLIVESIEVGDRLTFVRTTDVTDNADCSTRISIRMVLLWGSSHSPSFLSVSAS